MHTQVIIGKAHIFGKGVRPCLARVERAISKRANTGFDDIHQLSSLVLVIDRQDIAHFRILQSVQWHSMLQESHLPFKSSKNFSTSPCNDNSRISCPLSEHMLYDGLGFVMNSGKYQPQIRTEQRRAITWHCGQRRYLEACFIDREAEVHLGLCC